MKQILAVLALALPLPAFAQGTPAAADKAPAAAAPAPAAGNAGDMNTGTPVKDPVDMMREDIRHERADLLAKNMHFTAAQAAKFWPIYKQYETDRQKIGDERVKAIGDYINNVDTMTDAQAITGIKGVLARQDKYNKLQAKYAALFEKALPGKLVLRFFMIDAYFDAIINLQIIGQLPLVK
jgi:hypothetical protein